MNINKICKSFTCNTPITETIKVFGKTILPAYCDKCRFMHKDQKRIDKEIWCRMLPTITDYS